MGSNILVKGLTNEQLAKNEGNLIKYCKNKVELSSMVSEALYESVSLYSKETSKSDVFIMVADLIEDYPTDPVEVIINILKKIRKGYIKVYGKVDPHDLRALMKKELDDISTIRKNGHYDVKGYGNQDMSERYSGRLSDHFDKSKLYDKFKKK